MGWEKLQVDRRDVVVVDGVGEEWW